MKTPVFDPSILELHRLEGTTGGVLSKADRANIASMLRSAAYETERYGGTLNIAKRVQSVLVALGQAEVEAA